MKHNWLGRYWALLSDGGKCWSFEMCARCEQVRLLKVVPMQAAQADQFQRWDGQDECPKDCIGNPPFAIEAVKP